MRATDAVTDRAPHHYVIVSFGDPADRQFVGVGVLLYGPDGQLVASRFDDSARALARTTLDPAVWLESLGKLFDSLPYGVPSLGLAEIAVEQQERGERTGCVRFSRPYEVADDAATVDGLYERFVDGGEMIGESGAVPESTLEPVDWNWSESRFVARQAARRFSQGISDD